MNLLTYSQRNLLELVRAARAWRKVPENDLYSHGRADGLLYAAWLLSMTTYGRAIRLTPSAHSYNHI